MGEQGRSGLRKIGGGESEKVCVEGQKVVVERLIPPPGR